MADTITSFVTLVVAAMLSTLLVLLGIDQYSIPRFTVVSYVMIAILVVYFRRMLNGATRRRVFRVFFVWTVVAAVALGNIVVERIQGAM